MCDSQLAKIWNFAYVVNDTKKIQENTLNEFQCLRWQFKIPRKAPKFSVGQNFGGFCSSNNTWQHTDRIPSYLPWLNILCMALVILGVLIHHADKFCIPTYLMNRHGPLYTFSNEHNIRFDDITMFWVGKGSVIFEINIFRV